MKVLASLEIGGTKSYQSILDKVVDDMADFGDQSIMFQWYEYAQLLQQTVSMLKANQATTTNLLKNHTPNHRCLALTISLTPEHIWSACLSLLTCKNKNGVARKQQFWLNWLVKLPACMKGYRVTHQRLHCSTAGGSSSNLVFYAHQPLRLYQGEHCRWVPKQQNTGKNLNNPLQPLAWVDLCFWNKTHIICTRTSTLAKKRSSTLFPRPTSNHC